MPEEKTEVEVIEEKVIKKTVTKDEPPKQKPKKVEKVVTGKVTVQKQPLARKIRDSFLGDNMRSIGDYILHDIVLPTLKDLAYDSVSQGVERAIFGDVRRGKSRGSASRYSSSGYRPVTNYGRAYDDRNRQNSRGGYSERSREQAPRNRRRAYDEIIIETRAEAEEVLDDLAALIEQYDVASVSDLYQLVGITGSFTDDKYGWLNLSNAYVQRVREGYILRLPKAEPID